MSVEVRRRIARELVPTRQAERHVYFRAGIAKNKMTPQREQRQPSSQVAAA